MTTTQLLKLKESTSIFPTCMDTVEQSLIFVKRLVTISLSNITYLRTIFLERAYKDICEDGMKLKLLLDESTHKGANTLMKWIKSSFDAIEKGYLREMIFLVCEDETRSVIESYTYKFKYEDSGVLLEEFQADGFKIDSEAYKWKVQTPTIKMLRTILLLCQALNDLPERTYFTMRLHYYEDKTPKDYMPEGFVPVDDSISIPENYVQLKVGNVQTPFHCVNLSAAFRGSQFEEPATECATNVVKKEEEEKSEDDEQDELSDILTEKLEAVPLPLGLNNAFRWINF